MRDNSAPNQKDFWDKLRSLATTLSIVAVPIIAAYIGSNLEQSITRAEVNLRTTEVALEILAKPPTESGDAALREWAVEVLNSHSDVPLSDGAQQELVLRGLPTGFIRDLEPNRWGFATAIEGRYPLDLGSDEDPPLPTIPLVSIDKRGATFRYQGKEVRMTFGVPWRPSGTRCVVYLMAIDTNNIILDEKTGEIIEDDKSGAIMSWACE